MAAGLNPNYVRDAVRRRWAGPGADTHVLPNGAPRLVVNISARHCHVTQEDLERLFGKGHQLTPHKALYQDGFFAAEEMVTINQMAKMVMEIAGKRLSIKHIPGPLGVRGRNSDNKLIREKLGWEPSRRLRDGLSTTYSWIEAQVNAPQSSAADAVCQIA